MILNELRRLRVFQFGVGGTGSWLAVYVSKFLGNIANRFDPDGLTVSYFIIDPDIVEERNIRRQNFTEEDIGRSKVSATVKKNISNFRNINPAFRSIKTRKQMKDYHSIGGSATGNTSRRFLDIVFGCVDDNQTRRNIFSLGKNDSCRKMVYIDAGNDLYHGQVVTTAFNVVNNAPTFNNARFFKNPNIHKIYKPQENTGNNDNCAFFGDQTQGVNMMAANIQFLCLQQLLVNDTLPPNYYSYNSSGYSVFEI